MALKSLLFLCLAILALPFSASAQRAAANASRTTANTGVAVQKGDKLNLNQEGYLAYFSDDTYQVVSASTTQDILDGRSKLRPLLLVPIASNTAKKSARQASPVALKLKETSQPAKTQKRANNNGGTTTADADDDDDIVVPVLCRCNDGRFINGTMGQCQVICSQGSQSIGVNPSVWNNFVSALGKEGIRLK